MIMRRLMALMLAATSLHSMSLLAADSGCEGVFISAVYPLNLGVLQLRQGDTGWVFIDGTGASTSSDLVSQAANRPVSAGMIRVRAPEKSTLTLGLEVIDSGSENLGTKAFKINSLHVYGANNVKVRQLVPGRFEITLPESVSGLPADRPDTQYREVSTDLHIGIEASLTGVSQPIETHYSVDVSCLAITQLSR